jgi:hypothetical protein
MTRQEVKQFHMQVAEFIRQHPKMPYARMAGVLGITEPMLSYIARKFGIKRDSNKTRSFNPAAVVDRMKAFVTSEGK